MKIIALLALLTVQIAAAQPGSLPPRELFLGGTPSMTASLTPSSPAAPMMYQDAGAGEKKSVFRAVVYSLLLPGMGELYVGNYRTGKYFTIAEGGLWMGFTGLTAYANWTQTDAQNFAIQHAGANINSKEDQFFIDMGNFISAEACNQATLRKREPNQVYQLDSFWNWKWDTDADRERFRTLRVSANNTFNNARFALAAIVTNHLISAIDAGRMAANHNKSVTEGSLYDLHASVLGSLEQPDGVMLTLTRNF